MPPVPVYDVYPVRIQSPDREIGRARIVFTDTDHVLVYEDVGGPSPLILRSKITYRAVPLASNLPGTFVLESGGEWNYWRTGGCGCDSPLTNIALAHDLEEMLA